MFVGEKEIERVPCLAICHDKNSAQFTLYYCDKDWSPIGIASYDTVEAAKRRTERIYPGSSACWTEAKSTEEDAKRYLDETFLQVALKLGALVHVGTNFKVSIWRGNQER